MKNMKSKIKEIGMAISWRDFANTYFEKSPLWFQEKLEASDNNCGFSSEETTTLKNGLLDLSNRIKHVADSIQPLHYHRSWCALAGQQFRHTRIGGSTWQGGGIQYAGTTFNAKVNI